MLLRSYRTCRTRRSSRSSGSYGWAHKGAALCALCVLTLPLVAAEPSSAVHAPERLVRVGTEVVRLAREAGRLRQRYELRVRAAKDQRARDVWLTRQWAGQRFFTVALRRDAGAVARAQYRTGGFTAPGSAALAEEPLELLELQYQETDRRERLARMLIEADGRSRALTADRLSTTASLQALNEEAARLRVEKAAMEERLAKARSELNTMADMAIRSGRCTPVDLDGLQSEQEDTQDAANRPPEVSRSGWTRPLVSYELTAGFGGTGAHWANGHTGQDFAVPTGTPVRAVGGGTVVATGCGGSFGISVVIRHDGGWYSQYAHLSAPLMTPGRQVRAGEWIGLTGTTGNSTGPHLHFEVRTTANFGSAVDPVRWLRARGVEL
ncbi:M23 family metallopeptidase [Streptomyces luteoverticillatus]|uniref:M23 family metallopeptidase n=1 Tax=Streptomyces luteoverticillatus TaxID=66425 RepID=A0A3Q9G0A9_STRLT|nr:M23 family metallopeptidase [Streptomyces luteoverticillatus]AZQ72566.1 M23 family metallopeptidase [Streptomyces luteoverticillatus]